MIDAIVGIKGVWQAVFLFVFCVLVAPLCIKLYGLPPNLKSAGALWPPLRPMFDSLESLIR